jgi:hypothetical protein
MIHYTIEKRSIICRWRKEERTSYTEKPLTCVGSRYGDCGATGGKKPERMWEALRSQYFSVKNDEEREARKNSSMMDEMWKDI